MALSISAGFGGVNSVILVKKFEENRTSKTFRP
jgi:hypothetical protein